MNNTNQQLFTIYQNLDAFYSYRNLEAIDSKLDDINFAQIIQRDKYLVLSAVPKGSKNNTDVRKFVTVLVYTGTLCETKWESMQRLINHVRHSNADIMIITPFKIANGVAKKLSLLPKEREHASRTFVSYPYSLLLSVIPEFELAPRYEKLTDEEAREFDTYSLAKICENDPQVVWIGGKPGQILKYTYLSEVTIYAIGYCVVSNACDFD